MPSCPYRRVLLCPSVRPVVVVRPLPVHPVVGLSALKAPLCKMCKFERSQKTAEYGKFGNSQKTKKGKTKKGFKSKRNVKLRGCCAHWPPAAGGWVRGQPGGAGAQRVPTYTPRPPMGTTLSHFLRFGFSWRLSRFTHFWFLAPLKFYLCFVSGSFILYN